ncbi:carboxymuconolactone decarboxylase family protein [Verrucosispora sp. TAA-831]|uniref:carboxymuconolactone decarboxylase family protein n=1 Tax=Verrucosispora sp. TAA-831 TaxID=3422227 RepID=UPI003D6E884D
MNPGNRATGGATAPTAAQDAADMPAALRRAFAADIERWGRVRNLTAAVARSVPTWQATVRAEHMYVSLTRLDAATQAVLCVYTSMLNGCAYCVDDAAAVALDEQVTAAQLRTLATPFAAFDARVVAGLEYARWVVLAPSAIPPEVVGTLRRYVDDEELLELTAVVAMKCFWNRFVSALGIPPEGRCADPDLIRDLCRLGAVLRAGGDPTRPV